ncbi:MAG: sensor histidine kinase [Cellulosilyticaceae bacterium]
MGIEGLLLGIIVLLLVWQGLLRQQLKSVTKQLAQYRQGKGSTSIKMMLIGRELETLTQAINEHLTYAEHLKSSQRKSQLEIRRMIASIAHDLRTPLTSIIGYLQVLREHEMTPERRMDYLETTYRRAKDLEAMLGDFFALSVIESPEYQMSFEKINIGNLLCDVLAEYYDRFQQKGLAPCLQIPDREVYVIGDRPAIRRVLENLVTNMIRHTTGIVGVTLEDSGEEVTLRFFNACATMKKEETEKLFDRFYTRDESRGLGGGSTGLGLAIVKELMERMGAEVHSEVIADRLYMICKWSNNLC